MGLVSCVGLYARRSLFFCFYLCFFLRVGGIARLPCFSSFHVSLRNAALSRMRVFFFFLFFFTWERFSGVFFLFYILEFSISIYVSLLLVFIVAAAVRKLSSLGRAGFRVRKTLRGDEGWLGGVLR